MKVKVLMLCLATCVAVAATADAQQGNRRGPGGRGGPGAGSIFRYAGNEAVQKDLGLSTDAVAKVKTIVDAYREAAGQMPDIREMSDEDRGKAMEKWQASVKSATETYLPKLKDALSAKEFTRLQQIYWQAQGTAAYSDPELIKALPISQEQQDKMKAINAEYDGKRNELWAQGRGQGREFWQQNGEKFQQIDKDRTTKLNEVLTKEQQDKFASLKGSDFDFSEMGQGGPGRGPGGAGGANGGAKGKRPQPKSE